MLNIGENMAFNQDFASCLSRIGEDCFKYHYTAWPGAWSLIISFFFLTFGIIHNLIFYLSSILGAISIVMMFLFTYKLFDNEKIALWASFLLSILSIHLKMSGTAALSSINILMILLTFYILLCFVEKPDKNRLGLLLVFSTLFLSYLRIENFLYILLFGLFLWLSNKKYRKPKFNKSYWKNNSSKIFLYIMLLILLLIPQYQHLKIGVQSETPNWNFSVEEQTYYLQAYLGDNLKFWFDGEYSPLIYTILGLTGLALLFFNSRRSDSSYSIPIMLVVWFIIFYIFFSLYPAGNFFHGSNFRYSQHQFIPLILGAAYILYYGMSKIHSYRTRIIALTLIIMLLLLSAWNYRAFITSSFPLQKEKAHLRDNVEFMPYDCLLLSNEPFIINAMTDRYAVYGIYLQNPEVKQHFRNSQCKYGLFIEHLEDFKQKRITGLKEVFILEPYTYIESPSFDYIYSLYLLKDKR